MKNTFLSIFLLAFAINLNAQWYNPASWFKAKEDFFVSAVPTPTFDLFCLDEAEIVDVTACASCPQTVIFSGLGLLYTNGDRYYIPKPLVIKFKDETGEVFINGTAYSYDQFNNVDNKTEFLEIANCTDLVNAFFSWNSGCIVVQGMSGDSLVEGNFYDNGFDRYFTPYNSLDKIRDYVETSCVYPEIDTLYPVHKVTGNTHDSLLYNLIDSLSSIEPDCDPKEILAVEVKYDNYEGVEIEGLIWSQQNCGGSFKWVHPTEDIAIIFENTIVGDWAYVVNSNITEFNCSVEAASVLPGTPIDPTTLELKEECRSIQEIKERCLDVESYRYVIENGQGILIEYSPIGLVLPYCNITESQSTSIVKCYGVDGVSESQHINIDNATDASFSVGGTGTALMKWQYNQNVVNGDGVQDFTNDVTDCIDSGEIAYLTIVDVSGNQVTFDADSWTLNSQDFIIFGGSGQNSLAGKVLEAYLICGDGANSGEALLCNTCGEGGQWYDLVTGALVDSDLITDCVICNDEVFNSVVCLAEDVVGIGVIGDPIVSIIKRDCEGVVSSTQFVLPNGTVVESEEPFLIGDCSEDYDIEEIRNCVEDSEGNEWIQVAFYTANVIVDQFFINPNTLEVSNAIGDFVSCNEITDFEEICYYIPKVTESSETGWIDQDGIYYDCDLQQTQNAIKLDCDCNYSFIVTEVCIADDTGACINNFIRTVEKISDCDDTFANGEQTIITDTDFSGTEIIITLAEGDQIAPCNGCTDICIEACFVCDSKTAVPVVNAHSEDVKSQVKAVSTKLKAVKTLLAKKSLSKSAKKSAEKQFKALELRKKALVSVNESIFPCEKGETLQGKICAGIFYDLDGNEVDTTGYLRLETCEIKICPEPISIKGEVCLSKDWEIRFGEICPSEQYPEGKKVQWLEAITCEGKIAYESFSENPVYYCFGQWGGSAGEAPEQQSELGGCALAEGLATATSNGTCAGMDNTYVTGFNFSQTWVNFDAGESIEGTWSNSYTVGTGDELMFLTKWSTAQSYTVELLVNGAYSTPNIYLTAADFTQIANISDGYQFEDNCNTGAGNPRTYILKVSFSDFGVTSADEVTGVKVTFGGNDDDFSGAFITTNALLFSDGGAINYEGSVEVVGCCPTCNDNEIETAGCSTEANAQVDLGDIILTSYSQNSCTKEIEGLIQINVTQDLVLTDANSVVVEDCDVNVIRIYECLIDSLEEQWTFVSVIQNDNVIDQIYLNQTTGLTGVPSGSTKSWADCQKIGPDFEERKSCGYFLGEKWSGIVRTSINEDDQYVSQYFDFNNNSNPIVGIDEICCDDGCCEAIVNTDRNGIAGADQVEMNGVLYNSWSSFVSETGAITNCATAECHSSLLIICSETVESFSWTRFGNTNVVDFDCSDRWVETERVKFCERDDEKLLLVDSQGAFAELSFYDGSVTDINTLSVPSAGSGADPDNFILYAITTNQELQVVDVNTKQTISTTALFSNDGSPTNFSAAHFYNGFLYVAGSPNWTVYQIDVNTAEVSYFNGPHTGVAGSGTSLSINPIDGKFYISGSLGRIYEVSNVPSATSVGALVYTSPGGIANGSTFDINGNLYLTGGDNTYQVQNFPAGPEVNLIDNWSPGANSLTYYLTRASIPKCFEREFGIDPQTKERVYLGDYYVGTSDERIIAGAVDCCGCGNDD